MSRYRIEFEGVHLASVKELFPDGGEPRLADVFGEGGPRLMEFLEEWNYGEILSITVTDTETGEVWVRPSEPLSDWGCLVAAEDL